MTKIEMNVCRYLSEGVLTSQSLKTKNYIPSTTMKYRAMLQNRLTVRQKLREQDYVIYMN